MTMPDLVLPSWRPGGTRDAVLGFLEQASTVPERDRVACFDNDGTLWCERPNYVQLEFFLDALGTRVHADPALGEKPEFAALLGGDEAAIGELGLPRIALALTGLFAGMPPHEFGDRVRAFMATATHSTLNRPLRATVYQPMLELMAELRRHGFTVTIVSGGGTEFVRALSHDLYAVPPEAVVGTLIDYDYESGAEGPALRRSTRLIGDANEGAAKVRNIQTLLGRRPIVAAGNSGGDREMLEWARAGAEPSLALLVDHDDDEREFRYESRAGSFAETESIVDVGRRSGWTVVSMANDWNAVFPASQG
ncbi:MULTISPECIES: HAD family hydrolase [unclassified Nocardioides]|uniref:HAD family hydrolase n=1 Tax=unclassified Nocardioides TaxID=2615069 RepID=UPI00360DE0D2